MPELQQIPGITESNQDLDSKAVNKSESSGLKE